MIGQRLEPYRGVAVGLPPKFCDGRGSIPAGVNCEASRVLRELKGVFVFLHVSVRICMYLYVSVRICTYMNVSACICTYCFLLQKFSNYEMYIYVLYVYVRIM